MVFMARFLPAERGSARCRSQAATLYMPTWLARASMYSAYSAEMPLFLGKNGQNGLPAVEHP
ncbi:hypothetical protein DGM98_14125 [Xanthomonas citri]|uniref:Uncharacterized protein n=1 Tax=Xanthomonas citri pv. phaseoli var. fuscans TaxID=473423 RepID=A0AB33FCR1_XANCI|nr:hypothetical protein DGM98_14125 [Xanthomonas citri]